MKPTQYLFALILGICILLLIGFTVPSLKPEENQPSDTSTGKLDINAVCEGALAYMTFTDSASAEVFVSECKEGKHPEVIERFKADMNLGDGATI